MRTTQGRSARLGELAWVLGRGYGYSGGQVEHAIRQYMKMAELVTDRPAVAAGLALMALGGDFADGAIAHQGRMLGGEVFATFDRSAGRLLGGSGYKVMSPGS
jgi:predicted nucleic-acid-binding protein